MDSGDQAGRRCLPPLTDIGTPSVIIIERLTIWWKVTNTFYILIPHSFGNIAQGGPSLYSFHQWSPSIAGWRKFLCLCEIFGWRTLISGRGLGPFFGRYSATHLQRNTFFGQTHFFKRSLTTYTKYVPVLYFHLNSQVRFWLLRLLLLRCNSEELICGSHTHDNIVTKYDDACWLLGYQ